MLRFSTQCPQCRTGEKMYRSRRKSFFEWLFLLCTFLRAVRCHYCNKRYYVPRFFHVPGLPHRRRRRRVQENYSDEKAIQAREAPNRVTDHSVPSAGSVSGARQTVLLG